MRLVMKKGLSVLGLPVLALSATVAFSTVPALAGTVRDTRFEALGARLFPLLEQIASRPGDLPALRGQSTLKGVLEARRARRESCAENLDCLGKALIWTPSERLALSRAAAPLIHSGAPDDGAAAQLDRELQGINVIVETYGLSARPAYPEIDGAGAIDPAERERRLQAAALLSQTPREASLEDLDPSVEFALALLDGSDRTDAISFEPIDGGLNAAVMARAATLDWSHYRYSAIIVTGIGPEVRGMPLSPLGKYHVRIAATRFARGDAPFLLLTGGHAHPRATRFAEAVEMRKALIERYGVPADAIVIEPYARHTTTNLRNAARRLEMLGAPAAKEALIVCNTGQSAYIESAKFTERNARELGYQPGRIVKRLSPTELVFAPSAQVDRVDPRDPLDP